MSDTVNCMRVDVDDMRIEAAGATRFSRNTSRSSILQDRCKHFCGQSSPSLEKSKTTGIQFNESTEEVLPRSTHERW